MGAVGGFGAVIMNYQLNVGLLQKEYGRWRVGLRGICFDKPALIPLRAVNRGG